MEGAADPSSPSLPVSPKQRTCALCCPNHRTLEGSKIVTGIRAVVDKLAVSEKPSIN